MAPSAYAPEETATNSAKELSGPMHLDGCSRSQVRSVVERVVWRRFRILPGQKYSSGS